MTEQTPEEKAYLETRGGELPPKEEPAPEVVAESEAIEEAAVEEAEEEVPELKKAGLAVPYSRFKEERDKRKRVAEEAEELKRKLARFEGELTALKEVAKPAPAAPKVEDQQVEWNQDPEKAHNLLAKKVETVLQTTEQQKQQAQREAALKQFQEDYRSKVVTYTKDNPEFPEAYNFLAESRINEYVAMGISPEDAQRRTWADEQSLALNAMQSGKNPAEAMLAIAKARGFKPKAAEKTNGKATLEAVERGQKVNTSLGAASGGSGSGPLTLEAVADMEESEFRKMMTDENARAKFWKRHGG